MQLSGGKGHRSPASVGIKTRVIARSYGIKISLVCSFVLSESMRVTDGRTDRETDRQNYDPKSQDHAYIAASHGD